MLPTPVFTEEIPPTLPYAPGTFPHYIDNSMRETWTDCRHAFLNKYIYRRSPAIPSIHLHAGGAFAHGMEHTRRAFFDSGMSSSAAIEHGAQALIDFYGDFAVTDKDIKTVSRMVGALNYYFSIWPLESDFIRPHTVDGKSCVEINFTFPLPRNHPLTGEPLIYCGRFDMIGRWNDSLFGVDEKTASQLGPTWGKRYDLSAQFAGYTFGAKLFNHDLAGFLIRGVSILKESYGHAQHILYRPEWQLNRWYTQLLRDIDSMLEAYSSGYFDYALGHACSAFGQCDYFDVCKMQDELTWLDSPDYTWNTHNPLTR